MINATRMAHLHNALTKSGGTHDVSDVLDDIASGDAQLWEADGATVITEVVEYPNCRSFNVWLAGGDLDGVISLLTEGEDFARQMGCTRMEVTGRRGWKRVLRDYGFGEEAVVLSKEL